ncbi:MAG: hypothetical protein PHP31_08680 [Lentimicrobiaceae bacterium]|nr:hypothetical protein [Lentimicrobiaceae bacterium]
MRTKLMILIALVILPLTLITACNSGKKNNVEQFEEKAFYSGGLKYETLVRLSINSNGEVTGTVTSNEYGIEEEPVSFTGTLSNGEINVKFNSEPPIVGAASEWTNMPWRIEEREDKEVLIITFYAMDYETEEWGNSDYEFEEVSEQAN